MKAALDGLADDAELDAVLIVVAATRADPPKSKGTLWHTEDVDHDALLTMIEQVLRTKAAPTGPNVN